MNNKSPIIVGVIATVEDARRAIANPWLADAYEFRADKLAGNLEVETIIKKLKELGKLIILTVRDPEEGGHGELALKEREWLFLHYLPLADMVDVEARNARKLRAIITPAEMLGILVIISCHSLEAESFRYANSSIFWAIEMFTLFNADVLKIAVKVVSAEDMCSFSKQANKLMREFPGKVAPMPIGPMYGKSGRLEFARKGARLVYCSLDQPVVPGQWQAGDFRREFEKFSAC